jgi:hypothetical protein
MHIPQQSATPSPGFVSDRSSLQTSSAKAGMIRSNILHGSQISPPPQSLYQSFLPEISIPPQATTSSSLPEDQWQLAAWRADLRPIQGPQHGEAQTNPELTPSWLLQRRSEEHNNLSETTEIEMSICRMVRKWKGATEWWNGVKNHLNELPIPTEGTLLVYY